MKGFPSAYEYDGYWYKDLDSEHPSYSGTVYGNNEDYLYYHNSRWQISSLCCDSNSVYCYCSSQSYNLEDCNGLWKCWQYQTQEWVAGGNIYPDTCNVTPTTDPTYFPTNQPTHPPTGLPSSDPTAIPSDILTEYPSRTPTKFPTDLTTGNPTTIPSKYPTEIEAYTTLKELQTTITEANDVPTKEMASSTALDIPAAGAKNSNSASEFFNDNWIYFVIGTAMMFCCIVGCCGLFICLYCKNRMQIKEIMGGEQNLTSGYDINQNNVELIDAQKVKFKTLPSKQRYNKITE